MSVVTMGVERKNLNNLQTSHQPHSQKPYLDQSFTLKPSAINIKTLDFKHLHDFWETSPAVLPKTTSMMTFSKCFKKKNELQIRKTTQHPCRTQYTLILECDDEEIEDMPEKNFFLIFDSGIT